MRTRFSRVLSAIVLVRRAFPPNERHWPTKYFPYTSAITKNEETTQLLFELMSVQQTRTSLIFASHVSYVCVLILPPPLQRSHSPYLYSPRCLQRTSAELHDARHHRSTWSFPSPRVLCSDSRTARGHSARRCSRCSDARYPR